MLSNKVFKDLLEKSRSFFFRWRTYQEMWATMIFSEKALVITSSVMLLLFVASFSIYIKSKVNLFKEEMIEISVQKKDPSDKKIKAGQQEVESSSRGEGYIESHMAFDENSKEKEGVTDYLEDVNDKLIEETLGKNYNIEPIYRDDNSVQSLLNMSEDKVLESKRILSGEGNALSRIRKNKRKSTIKYNLEGRKVVFIQTPAYTCMRGGKVIVNVEVSSSGKVFSAKINRTQSNLSDDCLENNALKYARQARFETSPKFLQKGDITFKYISK